MNVKEKKFEQNMNKKRENQKFSQSLSFFIFIIIPFKNKFIRVCPYILCYFSLTFFLTGV